MQKFGSNTMASFCNFLVALSEIIIPNKIEHSVNGNLKACSLKGYDDLQQISSVFNVISRPYSGEMLAFMTDNFDNVNQFLGIIKRTFGLPSSSFRQTKNTRKYEIVSGKFEGIFFPSEEISSFVSFSGIPDGRVVHIGY